MLLAWDRKCFHFAVCGMESWANSVPSVYHSHSLQSLRLATANVCLLHPRAFHYPTVNSKYAVCIKLYSTDMILSLSLYSCVIPTASLIGSLYAQLGICPRRSDQVAR